MDGSLEIILKSSSNHPLVDGPPGNHPKIILKSSWHSPGSTLAKACHRTVYTPQAAWPPKAGSATQARLAASASCRAHQSCQSTWSSTQLYPAPNHQSLHPSVSQITATMHNQSCVSSSCIVLVHQVFWICDSELSHRQPVGQSVCLSLRPLVCFSLSLSLYFSLSLLGMTIPWIPWVVSQRPEGNNKPMSVCLSITVTQPWLIPGVNSWKMFSKICPDV